MSTLVTVVGLGRLFEGQSFLLPVLAVTLSAQISSWLGRRTGLGDGRGLLVAAATITAVTVWTVLSQSAIAGVVPGPATLHLAVSALRAFPAQVRQLAVPVPATTSFVLAAGLACGAGAIFADLAAFRGGPPEAALAPGLSALVVTGGLGTGWGGMTETLAWTASAGAFLLARRMHHLAEMGWPSARRRAALGRGVLVVAAALPIGALVGPMLPGSTAGGVVLWHNRQVSGKGTRFAVNPLVSIRGQLLAPSSEVAFVVRSPVPSYWRLTALDSFNGRVWSSDRPYALAKGRLPGTTQGSATTVEDHFSIVGLSNIWLPAAYRPIAVSGAPGARFDAGSGSIVIPGASPAGLSYTVQSRLPQLSGSALRSAVVSTTSVTAARNLQLPAGIPRSVIALADKVVAGHRTPFGKALALETFFRRNFRYSLSGAPSNSTSAMTTFLFRSREGYCQQFAGTYAVMARAVGLPARVAVGFTYGQQTAPGTWVVRALDAHAWPEVLLGRFGWVPFEPTPGRGNPAAVSYTHLAPAQAAVPAPGTAVTRPAPAATTSTLPAAAPPSPRSARTTRSPSARSTGQRHAPEARPGRGRGHTNLAASVLAIRRGRLGAAGIVLAAGALVAALAALSTRALWTKRSRTSGEITSPQRLPSGPSGPDRAEAIAHWNDAEGALWAAGFRAEPVASPTAFADSLAPELDRDAGAALRRLADVATWAYFSAPGSPVPRLGDAERDVRTVVAAARGLGTPPKRGSVRTGA